MPKNLEVVASCEVCEQEFKVAEKDIRLAQKTKTQTGGYGLVFCSNCCTTQKLPNTVPTNPDEITAWIGQLIDSGDWLGCIPLPPALGKEPAGRKEEPPNTGTFICMPGDASPGLTRRNYMFKYGVDPLCMGRKMGKDW